MFPTKMAITCDLHDKAIAMQGKSYLAHYGPIPHIYFYTSLPVIHWQKLLFYNTLEKVTFTSTLLRSLTFFFSHIQSFIFFALSHPFIYFYLSLCSYPCGFQ